MESIIILTGMEMKFFVITNHNAYIYLFCLKRFIFSISIFIMFFLNQDGYASMKIKYIPGHYLIECMNVARLYIYSTRGWKDDEYILKYFHVKKDKNVAVIAAIHNSVIEDICKRISKDGYLKEIKHNPLDVTLLIDIIDMRVLSEDDPDTFYPHRGVPLPYSLP